MSFLRRNKVIVLILGIFLAFRLIGLGADITNSDAIRWHRRSSNFLNALQQREYAGTYQHYQPGVTLMWLNSVVKYTSFKYQLTYTASPLTLEHAGYFPVIHGISKDVMVIVLAALLGFQIYLISNLFTKKISVLYGLMMTTEPFLIGVDRWFHLTSLEVYFGFTAFLALLLWKKSQMRWLMVTSAILLSLAIYSKLTAIVTAFTLLFVFASGKAKKLVLKQIFLFVLISLGVFILLLPALWVEPLSVIGSFYDAITNAVVSDSRATQLQLANKEMFYPLVLAFKLSPLLLFLLVSSLRKLKGLLSQPNVKLTMLYFVIYFVALTLSDKKIDRYSLALFPPLILLAAHYISSLKTKARLYFYILLIIQTIGFTKLYNPVYSAFYSPLVGGAEKALAIGIFENSGEYFSQAASYLNEKEGKLLVGVPNNIDSFAFNSKDHVTGDLTLKTDYIVWSHDIDRIDVPVYESCETIDKTFGTAEFDYLYVFKCTK